MSTHNDRDELRKQIHHIGGKPMTNQSEHVIRILESILLNAKHVFDYDRQIRLKIAELRKMSVEDSIKLSQRNDDKATAELLLEKANSILERLNVDEERK